MRRSLRLAVMLAAVAALAVLAAGCGSKKSSSQQHLRPARAAHLRARGSSASYDNGSAEKGGTTRVGWEQSFGFTNNFDPTGEYLGNAWGIYDNLLIRPLIGYKHQPAAQPATS